MQLSTLQTEGHVTKDLVLRTGSNGKTKYLRLNLAVDTGYGNNADTVFYQATFFDKEAEQLVKAKVKKGSFIALAGNIEGVIVFQPDGSEEIMSMIKVKPYGWGFVSSSKKDEGTPAVQEKTAQSGAAQVDPADFPEVECGVDDELPV